MRKLSLAVGLLMLIMSSAQSNLETADIVFKNGNIYTVNERQPHAEAVAVKAGKIIFVGSNKDVKTYEGKATRVVDLHGNTVVPGLTDSHYHLMGVGEREVTLNLEGTTSLEEFLAKVKSRVDRAKRDEWITGRGWIETFWKPPVFPSRWELDKIAPNNPVYLTRADGHASIANSAALKIAGINKETPNPFGGEFLKDAKTGEPTGMLIDGAQGRVAARIPRGGGKEVAEETLLIGIKRSLALGWCEVQIPGNSYDEVELLKRLFAEGKIKLRIYDAVSGPGPAAQKLLREGPTIGAFDNHFTVRGIKAYMDGALGSRGAALLEPYSDAPATSGFFVTKEESLLPMFIEALHQGVQIETHAIGDRGNRTILDLYEKAFQTVSPEQRKIREPRWRVEHAQIVNPIDIPRFASLGVIPSMQPSHAIGDLHFAPSRLGIKRLEGAYAWQSFIKSGSIVPGGSDAPVERGEPMIEFYAAVARKDRKGFAGDGWHPEQALSRGQALKMFTIWAAYAAFEETLKGSLEVGKLADLTVLSADIMTIAEPEILKTRCIMTVVGGETAYEQK
jgi:predicted amidohydrolase YtcJ